MRSLITTDIELVNRITGDAGRGEPRDRPMMLRTPVTNGSNDDSARLKSTRQAVQPSR